MNSGINVACMTHELYSIARTIQCQELFLSGRRFVVKCRESEHHRAVYYIGPILLFSAGFVSWQTFCFQSNTVLGGTEISLFSKMPFVILADKYLMIFKFQHM